MTTRRYKKGISLCVLAHSLSVGAFGNDGLIQFLEHCSPKVSEINLVDTSSNGKVTSEVSTIKPDNVRIIRSPYIGENFDFSKNRNLSLKDAKYERILTLDPDERIQDWNAIHEVENGKFDKEHYYKNCNLVYGLIDAVFYLSGEEIFYDSSGKIICRDHVLGYSYMARLFPNGEGYHFKGKVYEQLYDKSGSKVVGKPLFCRYEHHHACRDDHEPFYKTIKVS